MSEFVVVAILRARHDRLEQTHEALRRAIDHTHAEAGCVTYALHALADDPTTLVFVERWASAEALDQHLASAHIGVLAAKLGDLLVDAPRILTTVPMPVGDPTKGALAGSRGAKTLT
jgi:quinol monooxygenase YgiN